MQQMLANLRARREDERGFTLIELMVVVLIIAILIAIAIPTFLGAKSRAQDKAAESSLRNGLTNAKGIYTDSDSYGTTTTLVGTSTTGLTAAEPSLTFTAAATTTAKNISVQTNGTALVMAAKSAGGQCFLIADVASGPGTMFAALDKATTTTAGCDASVVTLPSGTTTATAGNAVAGTSATAPTWYAAW